MTRASEIAPWFAALRRKVGCLLLYGRTTPPPSITMMNGRIQVWIRGDQDEAFRIHDVIRNALHPGLVSWAEGVSRAHSERIEARALLFEHALRAISTHGGSGHWNHVYRERGGGYEGLRAIAEHALVRDALLRDSHSVQEPSALQELRRELDADALKGGNK